MSERDSDAPPDSSPKPAGDAIRRIDTVLGAHLPGLVEKEVLAQAKAAIAKEQGQEIPAAPPPRAPRPSIGDRAESPGKWRSPLQVGPDWLVALKSIPLKLVVIAVVGVAVGVMFSLSFRGCGGDRRYDDLNARVALLEKTVGVSLDSGRVSVASSAAIAMPSDDAGAPIAIASSAASASNTVGNAACANAKTDALAAWQDALGKAKQIAGPAEAQCNHILTSQHRQSCMATANAGMRLAQAARDTAMKGGAAAHNAVKSVRDDGRNNAIAIAKAASQTAFAACPDDDL